MYVMYMWKHSQEQTISTLPNMMPTVPNDSVVIYFNKMTLCLCMSRRKSSVTHYNMWFRGVEHLEGMIQQQVIFG